jgi:glutathione peroxidase
MKKNSLLSPLVALFIVTSSFMPNSSLPSTNINYAGKSFYSFKVKGLDGSLIELNKYKGKKILIINTASKCGFTPQYAKLQALHQKMGDKLVILGFPANNFGSQEPGTNSEISTFCTKNYGVTFQMMEKVSVLPPDACPLYHWLTSKEENGWNDKVPTWNFCKYLVNEEGKLTNFWESKTDPLGPEIAEALLK